MFLGLRLGRGKLLASRDISSSSDSSGDISSGSCSTILDYSSSGSSSACCSCGRGSSDSSSK